MQKFIDSAITEIEQENNLKVILASEVGSRCWGYSSKESDYDVKLLYIKSPGWYCGLENGADTITRECPEQNVNFHGWDLQKALRLINKGNASLNEWMSSPTIYKWSKNYMEDIETYTQETLDLKGSFNHYKGLARNNFFKYLEGKVNLSVKKVLAVLRAGIAADYIRQNNALPKCWMTQNLCSLDIPDSTKDEISYYVNLKIAKGDVQVCISDDLADYMWEIFNLDMEATKKKGNTLDKANDLFLDCLFNKA